MATESKLQKLTEENRRLAAELTEAREILQALRSGEVDALVSSGNDVVYAVQLIALAVDQAETYLESLSLLLKRLCHATGWIYGEAWATSENRQALQRTQVWYGADPDAIRLRESVAGMAANPALDIMLQALRSGEPQWVRLVDMKPNDYTKALRRCGLQAGLAIPLVVAGQVTTVLSLWRKERDSDGAGLVRQAREILAQAAPFVQRKRDAETRRDTLDALKGMVHERSRRLAELSGMLVQQNVRRERAETLFQDHQQTALQSQQAMERQGALLQSVLDGTSDGVIVTDLNGCVLHFNSAAQRMLGVFPDETPLEQWPEIFGLHQAATGMPLAANDLPLVKALRGETTDRAEIFVKSATQPDGRNLAVSARPLVDRDGSLHGAVAILQDITGQRREGGAQRTAARHDALVSDVRHRIKNHLAGVIALLHQHTAAHPETKGVMGKLEYQLREVASTHGLEATLAGEGTIEVGHLLRCLSQNTQYQFGKKVKMEFDEARLGEWRLRETESIPLALALNELLVNAHRHGAGEPLEIRAAADGKGMSIEIANKVKPGVVIPGLRAADDDSGGIALVRALLPHEKASLEHQHSGSRVSALVRLPVEVFAPVE